VKRKLGRGRNPVGGENCWRSGSILEEGLGPNKVRGEKREEGLSARRKTAGMWHREPGQLQTDNLFLLSGEKTAGQGKKLTQ